MDNVTHVNIAQRLWRFGIFPNRSGYHALIAMILHYRQYGEEKVYITKVYAQIGEQMGKTSSQMERNIRSAIHHSYDLFKKGLLEGDGYEMIYYHDKKKCPTNSEFISILAATI